MMIKSRLYSLPTVVLLLVFMLAFMSCRQVSPLPEDADSLVPTPAGVVVYKGNINGANLVKQDRMAVVSGNDTIYVTYRVDIETHAGTTRNDIISMIDTEGKFRYNEVGPNSYAGDITLAVLDLPTGITYDLVMGAFAFHISKDVKPGKHVFLIEARISGAATELPIIINVS